MTISNLFGAVVSADVVLSQQLCLYCMNMLNLQFSADALPSKSDVYSSGANQVAV